MATAVSKHQSTASTEKQHSKELQQSNHTTKWEKSQPSPCNANGIIIAHRFVWLSAPAMLHSSLFIASINSTLSGRHWFGFSPKAHTTWCQNESIEPKATNPAATTVILEEIAKRLLVSAAITTKVAKTRALPHCRRLVHVQNDQLPSFKWPLGRITAIHLGDDRLVRLVTVQTASEKKRASLESVVYQWHTMTLNRLKADQKLKTKRIRHQLKFILIVT